MVLKAFKNILVLVLICSFVFCSCKFPNTDLSSNVEDSEGWQIAYMDFLKNEKAHIKNNDIYTFGTKDLNNDKIPELLLVKSDENALNSILSIYSFTDKIEKIGDYSNPAGSFLNGFRYSKKEQFNGLFHMWRGGGQEYYVYISLNNCKIVTENIWCDNRTKEPVLHTELTQNQELLAEAYELYSDIYEDIDKPINQLELCVLKEYHFQKQKIGDGSASCWCAP